MKLTLNEWLKLLALILFLLVILALTWVSILPNCATEDSTFCYWNGGSNGTGHSFYSLWEGFVIYVG